MEIQKWVINGHNVDFIEDNDHEVHNYFVDGKLAYSVTQVLDKLHPYKGKKASPEVLKTACELGTRMHKAIEDYENLGIFDDKVIELYHYQFLKKHFGWNCNAVELPILIEHKGMFICGRVDMITEWITENGIEYGILDHKRVSKFDIEKVAEQVNLYRLGIEQSYGMKITKLNGGHYRYDEKKQEHQRHLYTFRINEEVALKMLDRFKELTEEN